MNKENDSEQSLVLKVGGGDKRNGLDEIRSASVSVLKILSTAALCDDDVMEEFFSEFANYSSIMTKMKSLKLADDSIPSGEKEFLANPMDCWMKVIVAAFSALYAMPDRGGVECDVVTISKEDGSDMTEVGACLSIALKLESFDWNVHKVDLFTPNKTGSRMLFIVDDEPCMYSIV